MSIQTIEIVLGKGGIKTRKAKKGLLHLDVTMLQR